MFIRFHRDTFMEKAQAVSRSIPSKSLIPSLNGILLSAIGTEFKLIGNDLQISIEAQVPGAVIEEQGRVVLPAKVLVEAIRKSPSEEISLRVVQEQNIVQLESGFMSMDLVTLPIEEYPEQPVLSSSQNCELRQGLLKSMIRQVSFAISSEELRPILTGAQLFLTESKVKLTALDGFRLATKWEEVGSPLPSLSAVVPGRTVNELGRLLDDSHEPVRLGFDRNYVSFTFSGLQLTSRLLEGDFPIVEQFIPKAYTTRALINGERLSQALERASLVSKDGVNGPARISLANNRLTVSAHSMELGRHSEEWDVELKGDEVNIMFNIRNMISLLKAAEAQDIVIDFHGPFGPCICRPLGVSSYLSLLMPVRLT